MESVLLAAVNKWEGRMTENQPYRHLNFENTRDNYAGITAAVVPALRATIEALAQKYDNKDGEWFDALQQKLIADAKGTITEGFHIDTEVQIIGLGVQVVQATLDVCRNNLIRE